MTPAFLTRYKDARVLLTGHTGFKGAYLTQWLHSLGAKVTGLSLAAEPKSIFDTLSLQKKCEHIVGDIRSIDPVLSAFNRAQPDVVFHLAAQAIVRTSYAEPVETLASNVMGTAHVLDAIRRSKKPCAVVVVTSDKCYEPAGRSHAHVEEEPMGGHDPYSMSKGASELVVSSYRHSFFPPANAPKHGVYMGSARAGNCIGGGDHALDRLVPDTMRALSAGEKVRIRNPSFIRPWQHVLEPLQGYLRLGAALLDKSTGACRAYNFGPPQTDAVPVRNVVDQLVSRWGSGGWIDESNVANPPENPLLMLDASRAQRELSWKPVLPLAEALDFIVEWTRAGQMGDAAKLQRVLESHIQRYAERLT